jgi:hypothetical protein
MKSTSDALLARHQHGIEPGQESPWSRGGSRQTDRRAECLHQHYRCGGVALWHNKEGLAATAAQVEAVLGAIDTLPFDSPADEIYGSIRTNSSRPALRSAVTIF